MKYLSYDENYWSLDVEADSLKPTQIWVVRTKNIRTGEKCSFRTAKDFNEWMSDEKIIIAFNGLHYDIPVLRSLWGADIPTSRCIDPMLLGYLLDPYLSGGHSLEAWGHRVKLPKISFDDYSRYTPEMEVYCERDADICARVYVALCNKLTAMRYSESAIWIEHHFAAVIEEQQVNGFKFDLEGAEKLYKELRDKEAELNEHIRNFFPARLKSAGTYQYRITKQGEPYSSYIKHTERYPEVRRYEDGTYECFEYQHFNVGSPTQRLSRLLEHGFKPTKKTKTGGWATGEDVVLEFFEESGIPEVGMIAEWLVHNGRANMLNNWLENLDRADNCIRGSVFTCGAGSRRCRHASPNTANIPSTESKFGAECRSLWRARDGRVLVGIDAAGLEGRVLVHYLGGRKDAYDYIIDTQNAFGVKDFHTLNAQQLTKAGIPKERKPCKNDFYAMIYGAQDKKLGAMSGGDEALGARIRHVLGDAVPGLGGLMEEAGNEFKSTGGILRTVDGGFVRCPSPHAALNYRCQSCGAIIMKLGAILLDREIKKHGWDALKVGDIHDEWQYDCDPDCSELVGQAGIEAIKLAGVKLKIRVPLDGTYAIAANWAGTH